MKYFTIQHIIMWSAIIIVVVLFIGLFKKKTQENISYKELIAAKDETIKIIQQQRDMLIQLRVQDSVDLSRHYKNDSLLVVQSKQIQIKYEKIPIYIMSLSKDSLRAAVYNY